MLVTTEIINNIVAYSQQATMFKELYEVAQKIILVAQYMDDGQNHRSMSHHCKAELETIASDLVAIFKVKPIQVKRNSQLPFLNEYRCGWHQKSYDWSICEELETIAKKPQGEYQLEPEKYCWSGYVACYLVYRLAKDLIPDAEVAMEVLHTRFD